MKKMITGILASLLALSSVAFFAACGGAPDGGDGGNTDSTTYTVTAEESDFYDVKGQTNSATAGRAAYVKIVPEFDAVSIDKVLFNGQECTESATEENRYEFTMPAANVEITVEYSFTDNDSDNFLEWNSENPSSFAMTTDAEEELYSPQYDTSGNRLTADVFKSPSQSGGYFSSHEETAFSMDQDVIPDEALSVSALHANSTYPNDATGFEVRIDRSKISAGTAQIVLRVENGYKFGDAALLVITVEVTEAAA